MGKVVPGRYQQRRQREHEEAKQRRAQVLRLNRAGKTQTEIGESLGLTRSRISWMIAKAKDEEAEDQIGRGAGV